MAAAPVAPNDLQTPLMRIERVWAARSFLDQLEKRRHDQPLLKELFSCIEKLWTGPQRSGLNLEQINAVSGWPILSARITRQFRLILTRLNTVEVVLLYFSSDHDEPYDYWIRRHAATIPRLIQRAQELPRGLKPTAPIPFVGLDDADPIAIANVEALCKLLDHGMAGYLAYLDDHQSYLAELDSSQQKGPTLIKGGAGTGKTALAIARLRYLAARPEFERGPVLYLCYNRSLREAVVQILDAQYGGRYPRHQIQVDNIHVWCSHYLHDHNISVHLDEDPHALARKVEKAWRFLPQRREILRTLSLADIEDEIRHVLRPNGAISIDEYVRLERKGAKLRLGHEQRQAIWEIYQRVRADRSKLQFDDLPEFVLQTLETDSDFHPYRGVVIDEGQDFTPVMMRLARALVGGDDRRLYVLADAAQSIYPSGFFWAQQELRVRGGQVRILKKPYRSTGQIQRLARSLYEHDVEVQQELAGTYDADRTGPIPELLVHFKEEDEAASLVELIRRDLCEPREDGRTWQPDQIAVLSPTWERLRHMDACLKTAGLPSALLEKRTRRVTLTEPTIKLLTVHAAKGLDFPVVYLCGLYRSDVGQEPTAEQRALLYVGMTRAGHKLTLSTVLARLDPLLYELDPTLYKPDGDAAIPFQNQRDTAIVARNGR